MNIVDITAVLLVAVLSGYFVIRRAVRAFGRGCNDEPGRDGCAGCGGNACDTCYIYRIKSLQSAKKTAGK